MKKAIGIHITETGPTPEEKAQLERKAKSELGEYRLQRIVAWDPVRKERVIRLDATQI